MWNMLHTCIPLDEALTMAEVDTVGRLWRRAREANLTPPKVPGAR